MTDKRYSVTAMLTLAVGLLLINSAAWAADAWPGFRGRGDSHAHSETLPYAWQVQGRSAGNWNVRLPGYGQSSPVVWNDRVFVTAVSGPEKEHLHVLAFALHDGTLLWQQDFAGTQRVADRDSVSRGAPTPVADASHLHCVFESGDIVTLTHDGDLVWQRSFVAEYGEIQGPHGYASSPLLVDDRLILQVAHAGPSYVLALDGASGENLWKVDHPSQTGWSTPAVFEHGGQRGVIVSTAGSVRALDLRDGAEIWRVGGVQGNSTASPTVVGDLVLIGVSEPRSAGDGGRGQRRSATGGEASSAASTASEPASSGTAAEPGSFAIRLGGRGDVSETHIDWKAPRVTTGYASPVAANDAAYFVKKTGVVQCVDLHTGELRWQRRLPGETWASPIAHNGHVIFFAKDGSVAVLDTGSDHDEFIESSISATDVVYGIAAADHSWIVRTGRSLLRITGSQD
jgi:outer membrane protein assembly factor BamB